MKRLKYIFLVAIMGLSSSCVDDLLNRQATTQVSSEIYWRSVDDVQKVTYSVYDATRTLFGRDYYFDGQSEFQNTRGTSLGQGSWGANTGVGSGFSYMWNNAYAVINRANYVLSNTEKMISSGIVDANDSEIKRLKGECSFLRALAYFRLIQLWGDVPYFSHVLESNAEALSLTRTPVKEIKDNIISDLTYAISVLPVPDKTVKGNVSQAAAYGFRGKVELYWASWKKYGWPEVDGFTQDASEAQTYYQLASDDFNKVIYDYGLKLFSEDNPGTYDEPAYWNLFTHHNETHPEIIFSIRYHGPNVGQGESMLRDMGTRTTGNAQCWVYPSSRLVDRYQKISTGDYADPVVLIRDDTYPNGAINPATYQDRDWRMKATILWDGQTLLGIETDGLKMRPGSYTFKSGEKDQSKGYINYDINVGPGYIYRKWVRQEAIAERTDGPQDFYLMRLADVYLMYCEAENEVNGPSAELVELVNKIRKRGNLPGLAPAKYADKDEFFKAIEQERIVEFPAEGIRPFDIRRWRKLEEIWGPEGGPGLQMFNTHNEKLRDEFRYVGAGHYGRFYIYEIPKDEIARNPKLTQNKPWLL